MEDPENLYARWHSGELTEEEYAKLKEEGILEDLEHIKSTTDRWKIPKYDSAVGFDKFKNKHASQKTKVRKINLYWISAVAACFALVFFVTRSMFFEQQQLLSAANGTTESRQFPDGSSVVVNDGSSITYNEDNWTNERKISLTGEASFEVSKGEPFIVNTAYGTIEVLGTQFNVRARGDNLYVECYEGRVRVSADTQSTILTAKQSVNIASGKMSNNEQIVHDQALWQQGISRFYEENVMSVFEEIEYQFDIDVKVPDLNRPFTGAFNHDDLETALRNICVPLGLKYSILDDQKTVLIE